MATRKTSQLTELNAAPANNDLVMVVDVSDTTMSASGTNKKVTITNLASAIATAGSVTSVNGQTGVVVLDSDDIYRTGSSGDTINTDLTAIESDVTGIKARLTSTATTTELKVDANNLVQIDSALAKATFTVAGVTAATIGDARSLFPALRVGASGSTYDLPTTRGTATGEVPVYDSSTNTSTWKALEAADLAGDSDDISEGTTNLFLTSSERTKLAGITAGAAVAAVTGTAPIVSSGGTSPAISITAATTSAAGSMSAADKTKLDGITAGAAVASVTGTAPIVSSGGTTPAIGITAATTSAAGSMSASDKSKLNGIAAGAEVNQNAFSNVAVAGQTTVAADSKTDTLTLVAGSNITLTTDATTDSITIASSGGGGGSDSFNTIAVAGQSDIVADSGNDTLTMAAAGGVTLTTNATTDTLTISSKWLADDNVVLNGSRSIDLNGDDFEIISGASSVASFATSGETLLSALIAGGIQYPTTDGTAGQVLQTSGSGVLSFVDKSPGFFAVESSSSTAYTLVSGDAGKHKRMTATTAITVTVNTGVFSTDDEVLFEQNNTGQITISAGSGVTLRNSSAFNPKSSERYAIIGLKCVASNEYILTGERELA